MSTQLLLTDCVFVITTRQHYEKINKRDIVFIQAEGAWVDIITAHRTYRLATNLGTVEPQLDTETFSRVSRKHIVNLCHIDWLQGNELSVSGRSVLIGPQYRENLLRRLPILRTKIERSS